MSTGCECNIVANYPWLQDLGFISVSLKTNTPIIVTSDGEFQLIGPTTGELSVSAYGRLKNDNSVQYNYSCAGRAGASYDWIQKNNCMDGAMYYIPRGDAKSFSEGETRLVDTSAGGVLGVNGDITLEPVVRYESVDVSASSGPATVYMGSGHTDGYDFQYGGPPIQVFGRVFNVIHSNGVMVPLEQENGFYVESDYGALADVLPEGSELFLTNISWEQTPPNLPTVTYSFSYTGVQAELLIDTIDSVQCTDENGNTVTIPV